MINSRDKLSPEDYLFLYWYAVLVENVKVPYDDFKVSESLIDRYNNYLLQWNQEFNSNPEHFVKAIDWDKNRTKTDYFKIPTCTQRLKITYLHEIALCI